MVKEPKFERDEVLKDMVEKPVVDGFRKGMTKEKLLKSLTEDDWAHMDALKAAEERMANGYSMDFFVRSDQAYQLMTSLKLQVLQHLAEIREMDLFINNNTVDILSGKTEQKDNQGRTMTTRQLETINIKADVQAQRYLNLIVVDLSRLYTVVGRRGLNKTVLLTEEDYNGFVEDCIRKLSGTAYKLTNYEKA
jgi:hypothetical protein